MDTLDKILPLEDLVARLGKVRKQAKRLYLPMDALILCMSAMSGTLGKPDPRETF